MKIKKNKNFKWILQENGGYVYNYSNGNVKLLNETGSYIVKLCENNAVPEIVTAIINDFEITDHEKVKKDVQIFIQNMIKEGYLCHEKE